MSGALRATLNQHAHARSGRAAVLQMHAHRLVILSDLFVNKRFFERQVRRTHRDYGRVRFVASGIKPRHNDHALDFVNDVRLLKRISDDMLAVEHGDLHRLFGRHNAGFRVLLQRDLF